MKHLFLILTFLILAIPVKGAEADATVLEKSIQEAIKKAEPSIACILVSRGRAERGGEAVKPKLDMSHPDYVPEAYGSGVVIDREGLILTNAHVVRGATRIFVRLPGSIEGYAEIHALDARSDLAVLRLNGKTPPLQPLVRGDGDAVKKGQFVVALSNPFAAGFPDGSPSASVGIISNLRRRAVRIPSEKDRRQLALHQFATLIQTDARINAGCSGGALINLKGELIGLTTAHAALTGLETPGGFALPMDSRVKRIIEVLARGEEVEYGFLGVSFSETPAEGVRLAEVIEQSPGKRAGLRRYDYLVSIGGVPVRCIDDVFLNVGMMLAGNTVEIERSATLGGRTDKVTVTLGKFYHEQLSVATKRPRAMAGLRVDYSSLVVQRVPSPYLVVPEGVLIREVETGSPADKARLQPDKVISHVNGRKVLTPAEFYEVMGQARGDIVLMLSKFDGGFEQVTLKTP
jgi:S1-C subfamily serine protease